MELDPDTRAQIIQRGFVTAPRIIAEELHRPVLEIMDYESLLRRVCRIDDTLPARELPPYVIAVPTGVVGLEDAALLDRLDRLQQLVVARFLEVEDCLAVDLFEQACGGLASEAKDIGVALEAITKVARVKRVVVARKHVGALLALGGGMRWVDEVNEPALRMAGYVGAYKGVTLMTVGATSAVDPMPERVLYGLPEAVDFLRVRTEDEVRMTTPEAFRFHRYIATAQPHRGQAFAVKYRF